MALVLETYKTYADKNEMCIVWSVIWECPQLPKLRQPISHLYKPLLNQLPAKMDPGQESSTVLLSWLF